MESLLSNQKKLLDWFRPFRSCAVAFSGGLDSTVVAKAASLAIAEHCVAVTARSESSRKHEGEEAQAVADSIPIRSVLFESQEINDPAYTINDRNRCYHCKRIRFEAIAQYARENRYEIVVDGSNADDLNDFRPGKQAVEENGVRSPLSELGITKAEVRQLARYWNLPNSELPASPCLSTRLSYGLEITDQRLRMIEQAEDFLASLGFSPLRVRLHPDNLARIEVKPESLNRLISKNMRTKIITELKRIGFDFVSVELEGFRSGSMNVSVQ